MSDRTCSVEDCERIARAKGWCSKHYYQLRADVCTVAGCLRPLRAKRMCAQHYRHAEQPVTARENTAEMFERNHYLSRIAALEAALMELAPGHPLVTSITETSTAS